MKLKEREDDFEVLEIEESVKLAQDGFSVLLEAGDRIKITQAEK